MKKFIFLLAFFTFLIASAQETDIYKKVTISFQENFNTQNVDAIFALYANDMQEAMTKEGVSRFVTGCFEQFGSLKKLVYTETIESVNSYKATFEKAMLEMQLQLTEDGKIATIQFHEL